MNKDLPYQLQCELNGRCWLFMSFDEKRRVLLITLNGINNSLDYYRKHITDLEAEAIECRQILNGLKNETHTD